MDGSQVDIAVFQDKDAFEAAIVEAYDTEEERQAARDMYAMNAGIDYLTGNPIDEDEEGADPTPKEPTAKAPGTAEPSKEDEDAKAAQEAADAKAAQDFDWNKVLRGQEGAAADAEAKAGSEGADKDGKDGKPGLTLEPPEKTEEQKKADEALAAANARIAELEAQNRVRDEAPKIREAAERRVDAQLADSAAKVTALEKRVKDHVDQYGEEDAGPLKESATLARQMFDQSRQTALDAEIGRITADRTKAAQTGTETDRAIAANPELAGWHADHLAAKRGEAGKSSVMFQKAQAFDTALGADPAWKGKPLADRFAEAVRLVKVASGDTSLGTPNPPKETDEGLAKKLQEEERNKPPGSMTEIPGGEAPASAFAALERLDPNDMALMVESGAISLEAVDEFLERTGDY